MRIMFINRLILHFLFLQGNEPALCEALDGINEIVSYNSSLVDAQLPSLLDFLLHVVQNPHFEISTVDASMLVINTLAEWKPNLLGRSGKVPNILDAIGFLIANAEGSVAGALFTIPRLYDEDYNEEEEGGGGGGRGRRKEEEE